MCSHCRRLLPAVPTWPTQLDCSSKSRQAYPDTKAPCQKDHSWVWTLLTQSPAAKSGQLCLTKAVPILQANGQLCLLLGSVLNCLDPGGVSGPPMMLTICPLTFFYLNFISIFPTGSVEPFQLHWPLQSVSRAVSAGLCLTSELFKCISVELSSSANSH